MKDSFRVSLRLAFVSLVLTTAAAASTSSPHGIVAPKFSPGPVSLTCSQWPEGLFCCEGDTCWFVVIGDPIPA